MHGVHMSTNLEWTRVLDLAYFQQRGIFENASRLLKNQGKDVDMLDAMRIVV